MYFVFCDGKYIDASGLSFRDFLDAKLSALPALWVGLLYDQGALDAAWDLVKDWNMEDRQILRDSVPRLGLDAPIGDGRTLRDIAQPVLDIARAGLGARGRLNAA